MLHCFLSRSFLWRQRNVLSYLHKVKHKQYIIADQWPLDARVSKPLWRETFTSKFDFFFSLQNRWSIIYKLVFKCEMHLVGLLGKWFDSCAVFLKTMERKNVFRFSGSFYKPKRGQFYFKSDRSISVEKLDGLILGKWMTNHRSSIHVPF